MEEVTRVRYFDHEFLEAVDFEVEQEYHRSMRYRHIRHFHTWGLAHNGLEVDYAEGQNAGEETKVVVLPGIALDNQGREIVLTESRVIDFDQPQYKMANSYYITVRWHEQHALPLQGGEHKRWVENPHIDVTEEMPEKPDIELVLARVKLREKRKLVETIDGSMRTYAAHEVGDKTVSSVKILAADGESGQDIAWGSGIKTPHIQDEAVTLAKLSENARQFITPVGCVAAFAMETPPTGWLECDGQAISRKEYERLFNRIGVIFGAGDGGTTFNVPDLRGEFLRGWDSRPVGDAIDPARSFGSRQNHQIQSHKHEDSGHPHEQNPHSHSSSPHSHVQDSHVHDLQMYGGHEGDDFVYPQHTKWKSPANWVSTNARTPAIRNADVSMSAAYASIMDGYARLGNPVDSNSGAGEPLHGNETRPVNIALMYCIKY